MALQAPTLRLWSIWDTSQGIRTPSRLTRSLSDFRLGVHLPTSGVTGVGHKMGFELLPCHGARILSPTSPVPIGTREIDIVHA